MFMVPSGFRSLLTTGPGPDKGGSKKSQLRPHMPEKSGTDAAVAAASPADSTVSPKAGVAVAASVTSKRKFHSLRIPVSPRGLQKLAEHLLSRNGLDQWRPARPSPHRLKLVNLVDDVTDEDRRGRAAPHHYFQHIRVLTPASDPENETNLEKGQGGGVAAGHPLPVLRNHAF